MRTNQLADFCGTGIALVGLPSRRRGEEKKDQGGGRERGRSRGRGEGGTLTEQKEEKEKKKQPRREFRESELVPID